MATKPSIREGCDTWGQPLLKAHRAGCLTEVASREQYLVSVDKHQVAFLQLHGGFHGEDLYLLDGRAIDWPEKGLSAGGRRRNPF